MKPRLHLLVAVALASASVAFGIHRLASASSSSPPPVVHASLPARPASYLGVFVDGAPPGYDPIADFAQAAKAQPNLVGYYSGWAQPFDASFAKMILAHGVHPFVQIDPTDVSMQRIADGIYDGYLRSYADDVSDFGHAVVIGFGHEMNAPTYTWGYGRTSPAVFKAAWQHVVSLFRREGALNVIWLWTLEADGPDTGPIASWWPGARYVSWVGIDGYYYTRSDRFVKVFLPTIDQVRRLTDKPILLSETAVGPRAGQYFGITDLFDGMRLYKILGLVWFDEKKDDGIYRQDWRIEGNKFTESPLKLGISELTLSPPSP